MARTLLVALVCFLTLVVAQPTPAQAAPTRAEKRLLRAVNHARANHGLVRVRIGSRIQSGAHSWARYLRHHDTFFHGRLSSGMSENIGWLTCRRGWARTLVRMWLNSSGHRANLLDRSARRIGVGVSTGRWSGYRCVRMAVTRFR